MRPIVFWTILACFVMSGGVVSAQSRQKQRIEHLDDIVASVDLHLGWSAFQQLLYNIGRSDYHLLARTLAANAADQEGANALRALRIARTAGIDGIGEETCRIHFLDRLMREVWKTEQGMPKAEAERRAIVMERHYWAADSLARLAGYRMGERDMQAAVALYDSAARCFRAAGDSVMSALAMLRRADAVLSMTGREDEAGAIVKQAKAILVAQRHAPGLALLDLLSALANERGHRYAAAKKGAERALAWFQRNNDAIGAGRASLLLGRIAQREGRGAEARRLHRQASTALASVHAVCPFSIVEKWMGDAALGEGRLIDAQRWYAGADHDRFHPLTRLDRVSMRLAEGGIHLRRNEARAAREKYLIAQRNSAADIEPSTATAILTGLARAEFLAGSLDTAFARCREARALAERLRDDDARADAISIDAGIYAFLADTGLAVSEYRQARELYAETGNIPGLAGVDLALARYLRDGAQRDQHVSALYRAAASLLDTLLLAHAHVITADIGKGTSASIDAEYARARELFLHVGDLHGLASVTIKLGDRAFARNDRLTALHHYDSAVAVLRRIDAPEALAYGCMRKATIEIMRGRKADAGTCYAQAIEALEHARRRIDLPRLRQTYFAKIVDCYVAVAEYMIDWVDTKDFHYLELMKARNLADNLTQMTAMQFVPVGSAEKAMLERIATDIEMFHGRLAYDANPQALQDSITMLKRRYDELLLRLRSTSSGVALGTEAETLTAAELATRVLHPDEALIEYVVFDTVTYAYAFHDDVVVRSPQVVRVDISRRELKMLVDTELRRLAIGDVTSSFINGSPVYERLLAPVFRALAGGLTTVKTLIIAPDDELGRLPFEMLPVSDSSIDGRPEYLLDRYTVTYIQSGTVLKLLRRRSVAQVASGPLLAFGNPEYVQKTGVARHRGVGMDSTDVSLSLAALRSEDLERRFGDEVPRLPASGEEVQRIGAMFREHGARADVLVQSDATVERLKSTDLRQYTVVHLACHGAFAKDHQCLILGREGGRANGYLGLTEIAELPLANTSLVTLSACQTGVGRVMKGEGVVGMTRAFMLAGAPAVVVSLRTVSDNGTKELMIRFYRHLLAGGMSKAEALRQSKLEMLRDATLRLPGFWAPFVMYGE